MATSARIAYLLEQRRANRGLGLFGDRRRILAPSSSSGLNSITKRTITAETSAMVKRYNDGLIGNDEMQAFLKKQSANPVLTPQEKVELEDQVRDFDQRIVKDKLESNYKSAPEGSLAQVQAAQSLADYYNKRAEGMVPGTPAHSQSLENAGVWANNVTTLNNKAELTRRKNLRYIQEQQINQLPTNSSDRAIANAQGYQQLSEQANTDGDPVDANRFQALAYQSQTQAQELQTREETRASVQQVREFAARANVEISKLKDNSPEELQTKSEKAMEVAQMFSDIGDEVNANRYMVIANQAQEKYNKALEENPKQVMQAEIDGVLKDLRQMESDYRYGKEHTWNDGTKSLVTGDVLADKRHTAYSSIVQYYEQGIKMGVKGLEDNVRTYRDYLDKATNSYEKWRNGEIIDVVDKSGKVQEVDVSDPEQRQKYVQGANGQYRPLMKQISNVPGASNLTPTEMRDALKNKRAYVPVDESGYGSDVRGNPIFKDDKGNWNSVSLDTSGNPIMGEDGKPVLTGPTFYPPKYVPEQYVNITTPTGTERVWSQHDETGNIQGWLPEKSSGIKGAQEGLLKQPETYTANILRTNTASSPTGPVNIPPPEIEAPIQTIQPTQQVQGPILPQPKPNATSIQTKMPVYEPPPAQPIPSFGVSQPIIVSKSAQLSTPIPKTQVPISTKITTPAPAPTKNIFQQTGDWLGQQIKNLKLPKLW